MAHPTRIFQDSEELYKAFEEYKKDLAVQSEEWLKVQYVGKEGTRVTDGQKLPLTLEGFENYYYRNYKKFIGQYFDNKDKLYDDFVAICSQVKKEIRENQITGGLLGFYNPSITQRLNGLAEKNEVSVSVEQPLFGDDEENGA